MAAGRYYRFKPAFFYGGIPTADGLGGKVGWTRDQATQGRGWGRKVV